MDRRGMPEHVGIPDKSSHKWWVLAVAAAGVLLATIDASIVNVALPTISDYFQTSVRTTAWVTISYLLIVTAFLLIFGRLSDQYGQKLIFISGMVVFTFGSGLCALSQTIGQLIGFRVLQGLGAAMIMSNTPAIVTNAFPSENRGMGLGVIGSVVSVGLMLGPPLGGMIIHYYGWKYIFLVNLPVGIAGIIFSIKMLREFKAASAVAFRVLDAIIWIVVIISFVLVFGIAGKNGFNPKEAIVYSLLTIALVILFFIRQWRSDRPLFDTVLLKNRVFMLSCGAGFFSYMGMIGLSFMLPFLLEKTFVMEPLQTGRVLMVIPATTVFVSPLAGYLSDRLGQRPISTMGLVVTVVSMLFLFQLQPDSSVFRILVNLVGFGLGLGFFGSPNNSALMGSVDYKIRGSAAGLLATVRNLGMVSGVSIVSLIFNSALAKALDGEIVNYAMAFKSALPVVIVFAVLALILSGLRRSV
ncbi:MAG: MFS transporter [candidate division Zixibacteria bacterium]